MWFIIKKSFYFDKENVKKGCCYEHDYTGLDVVDSARTKKEILEMLKNHKTKVEKVGDGITEYEYQVTEYYISREYEGAYGYCVETHEIFSEFPKEF